MLGNIKYNRVVSVCDVVMCYYDVISYGNIDGNKYSLCDVWCYVFYFGGLVEMFYDKVCGVDIVCCYDVMFVVYVGIVWF